MTGTPDLATGVLYYGDNLDILRRYLPDAAVDLVYLDPPFATDTLPTFEDTWHWGPSADDGCRNR
jgi:16S rRNA G966 N2-methylase RsmD